MPYISKLQVINMHVLDVMTFTKKKKITRHKGFKIALEAHTRDILGLISGLFLISSNYRTFYRPRISRVELRFKPSPHGKKTSYKLPLPSHEK